MTATRLVTTLPFDGEGLMRYFSGHAISDVESGNETEYRRLIRFDGVAAELCVRLDQQDSVIATMNDKALPRTLVPAVRRLFDLNADSREIDAHLATDPALTDTVMANPGIRVPGALDAHEQLMRTMIGQQISIAATRTILARLARELDGSGLFPSATQFSEKGLDALRGPATRIAAIHGTANALHTGALEIHTDLTPEELTKRLVAVRGIGPWTAGYVAMRVLGAPDVLLSSDLVLLKGAAKLGLPSTARGISEYGLRWAPYRSYATLHLWRAAQSPAVQ